METITNFRIRAMSPLLIVRDLETAIRFYTGVLGFETDFVYDDFYASISKDGFSVHLKESDQYLQGRQQRRKNEDLDLVISVDDIEHLYSDLMSKSVEIVQPLRTMPYAKEFYIADPEGYLIGFLEGS